MIEVAAYTTRGLCKLANEDRAFVNGAVVSEGLLTERCEGLCCLAAFDGVSAGGRGCEASGVASSALAGLWAQSALEGKASAQDLEAFSRDALAAMAFEIDAHRTGLPAGGVVASTVAGLVLEEDGATVAFNEGDSRAYRWRDGILVQLTTDHTPEQVMADLGITEEQDARAEKSHVITRAIGLPGSAGASGLVVRQGLCLEGDVFLACSDGLTDVVEDDRIASVLAQDASAGAKARTLGVAALRAGVSDNVTVIVAQAR